MAYLLTEETPNSNTLASDDASVNLDCFFTAQLTLSQPSLDGHLIIHLSMLLIIFNIPS
jgi:hypothetical protein